MITLKHSNSNFLVKAPTGFSWTTLFFGVFVPLFRGDILWSAIMLILAILTFGLSWLIFPFIYNSIYIKELLKKGLLPADKYSENYLKEKGWFTV